MTIGINRTAWEKIGQATGWLPMSKSASFTDTIRKNLDDYYNQSQSLDIGEANFAVDLRHEPVKATSPVRNAINNKLHGLGNYHKSIPLDKITAILAENNVIMLQEDGTPWQGFIMSSGPCGENNKPFNFDLAIKRDGDVKYLLCDSKLVMTVCTMPAGTYEVVAYMS